MKSFFEKIFNYIKKYTAPVLNKRNLPGITVALITWIILTSLLSFEFLPTKKMAIGDIATEDIQSLIHFSKEDKIATARARTLAAQSVPVVFTQDQVKTKSALDNLSKTFDAFVRLKDRTLSEYDRNKLEESIPLSLTPAAFNTLLSCDREFLINVLAPIAQTAVNDEMEKGVREEALSQSVKNVKTAIYSQNLEPEYADAIAEVASSCLQPNISEDWKSTARAQEEKMAEVKPIMLDIPKGQIIIRKGEVVTPKHTEILEAMGLYKSNLHFLGIAAAGFLILFMMGLVLYELSTNSPAVLSDRRLMLILAGTIVVTAFICRFTTGMSSDSLPNIAMLLAPVAAASMLITLMINSRTAIMATLFLGILTAVFAGSYMAGIICILTGMAAIQGVAKASRRGEIIIYSLVTITLANMLIAGTMAILTSRPTSTVAEYFLLGAVNGITSALLGLAGVFVIEAVTPIASNLKLLELANPAEPLLQRLTNEAPGTHVHCVLVANLAEAGANAIKANPLLARVGAYYHDIGKLKKPALFIENQFGIVNPHEKIAPRLSKLILISHVKYGVELAKQYRLPAPVIDMISQHHGTSLIAYFHHQAKKQYGKDVSEQDFRYPGPKPQTKEAAIIMMADSIEAAVRSLSSRNQSRIETLINTIIDNMLFDGQFDECELSFKNVKDLKKVFLKSILSMYHARIKYPDKVEKEFSDGEKNRK